MSRGTWNRIKHSKGFYIRTYRKAGTFLMVSINLNFFLGIAIYYTHFHQPASAFYATNGVTPPIQLTSMDAPNNSPTALLPPDPPNDDNIKIIPQ